MNARTQLFTSAIAVVENVVSARSRPETGPEGFSPDFQVALPYRGLFIWHVGNDAVVGDANQILFVTGGEAYRASSPCHGGYAEIIITPSISVLSDLTEAAGFAPCEHPLFQARSRRATPALQGMCAHLLHSGTRPNDRDALRTDEQVLDLLRAALHVGQLPHSPSGRTRRLISRTREFLDAEFSRPIRLSEVADAVGTSPAYLTDVFRRFEGVSLQRYVTQLRLARALIELPHAEDLTTLALDLGFSSHSHFTLAFRRAFGCPPSRFRARLRHGNEIA